jgi:hypothetical protein
MKYWDSRLNALGLIIFTARVHVATTMIGWRCSRKERIMQI